MSLFPTYSPTPKSLRDLGGDCQKPRRTFNCLSIEESETIPGFHSRDGISVVTALSYRSGCIANAIAGMLTGNLTLGIKLSEFRLCRFFDAIENATDKSLSNRTRRDLGLRPDVLEIDRQRRESALRHTSLPY